MVSRKLLPAAGEAKPGEVFVITEDQIEGLGVKVMLVTLRSLEGCACANNTTRVRPQAEAQAGRQGQQAEKNRLNTVLPKADVIVCEIDVLCDLWGCDYFHGNGFIRARFSSA